MRSASTSLCKLLHYRVKTPTVCVFQKRLYVLLGDSLGSVGSIVFAFNFLNHLLHLGDLTLPFLLSHLGFSSEKLLVWLAVAASESVPQCCVLTVIVVEVQVVHGVASSTVQDWAVGNVFAIVNEDGPELHKEEETEVGKLLEREDEGENVVWYRLHPAINGVECDGGIWCGHDPLVMWLV